jgi:hypothetical protein
MKLHEIKTVTQYNYPVITPTDTFGDVMKCMPNLLADIKKLALDSKIPGKVYSEIMKLKVKVDTLHGKYTVDDVLISFGRDPAPSAFVWCEVIPFVGFCPVDIRVDSPLQHSRTYIKLELNNEVKYIATFNALKSKTTELFDSSKANLIRQIIKTVHHNAPSYSQELKYGYYDSDEAEHGTKIFGWVVFQ